MKPDDAQMRDILSTKEYLMRKADEHKTELDHIQRCIEMVDSFIKKSSFTRASELPPTQDAPREAPPAPQPSSDASPDSQPITVNSQTVAHTTVTPNELRITISDGVALTSDTPPLKSFFIDRIIGGMRARDEAQAKSGKLAADNVIACTINEDEHIRDITIRNYREKDRIEEIIKSVSWSLSRMVENSAR